MDYSRNESLERGSKNSCVFKDATMGWPEDDCDNVDCMPLGMAYVPWQHINEVYEPSDALQIGTIFPELDLPFLCYRFSGGRRV